MRGLEISQGPLESRLLLSPLMLYQVPVDAIFPVSVESVPESSTLNKKGNKTLTSFSFSSVLSKQPVEIS